MQSHRRVLLLNASYEALNIVSAPKALALVWRRVAEVIEDDPGETICSLRFTFQVPSVIRLTYYVDVRSRQNRTTSRLRIPFAWLSPGVLSTRKPATCRCC